MDVHVITTFPHSMRSRRTGPIPGDRGLWGTTWGGDRDRASLKLQAEDALRRPSG
jgi:hypothetical protein